MRRGLTRIGGDNPVLSPTMAASRLTPRDLARRAAGGWSGNIGQVACHSADGGAGGMAVLSGERIAWWWWIVVVVCRVRRRLMVGSRLSWPGPGFAMENGIRLVRVGAGGWRGASGDG